MYKLKEMNQREYDLILTTVPISFPTSIPVIEVQYFLNGSDVIQLSDAFKAVSQGVIVERYFHVSLFFIDIDEKSKEDVLSEMVKRVSMKQKLPKEFLDSLLQREQLSSTEFGNMIALPHPMKAMCQSTFVAVAILKKPIRWHKQSVRFVFLLCVQKDALDSFALLHETLSSLVSNKKSLLQLEKDSSFKTLTSIIDEISKIEESNMDRDDIFR